ncbi:Coenzyme F420 hydrogenase/dehydrogenase, beta subunit C-terminal domain [uncultured Microbacterium sp.]|uniref:Coenzyme F420 hydrogenase/dehydrogenase, beta subunit C-terminal domain n=1 Tax=uncultured Microbacterium sp. TaxID=191216 RepID=UPI00260E4AAD|nr:Coenzyme F420 hydrogenase/dehydrogenase, beta subunit C-terminal domain [uncultured Microbacterium sp.]
MDERSERDLGDARPGGSAPDGASAWFDELNRRVLAPDLNVRSGVYAAFDPSLKMEMSARGEYEYVGLGRGYDGPAQRLLEVSAFGGLGPTEDEVAKGLFPDAPEVTVHPIIGRYRSLYAGFVAEGDYRDQGSSGGLGTWVLCELLEQRKIDGVLHIKPSARQGILFEYQVSRTPEEVRAGSGSRYYPGQLTDVMAQATAEGGRYAVTAIPSVAYEIRLLQKLVPEYEERFPFVVGLICGHQKTANYASQLAWRAGVAPKDLRAIDFRRKQPGKSANDYATEVIGLVDGEATAVVADDLFGTDWGLGLFKANFSDFTEDVFNETADVVLGDAWLPEYTADSLGTNVVVVRSQMVDELISAALDAGRIQLVKLSESNLLKSQAALVRQNVDELAYRFEYLASQGGYVPIPRRSSAARVTFERKRVQVARLKASTESHRAWQVAREANDLQAFDDVMSPLVTKYRRAQTFMRAVKAAKNPKLLWSKAMARLAR